MSLSALWLPALALNQALHRYRCSLKRRTGRTRALDISVALSGVSFSLLAGLAAVSVLWALKAPGLDIDAALYALVCLYGLASCAVGQLSYCIAVHRFRG